MAFDYKKEYKEFYLPKNKPGIVEVPPMNYIAVRGKGNPNVEGSEYKNSIGLLYGIAFTIKMSKKGNHQIEGYFDYVVPPLEGFWWQEAQTVNQELTSGEQGLISGERKLASGEQELTSGGRKLASGEQELTSGERKLASGKQKITQGIDYSRKEDFQFLSVIRLPDFVTKEEFDWAIEEATRKKQQDFSKVEFLTYEEGLCVQCMHIGPYDDEPATIERMHEFMTAEGYELDITGTRLHHEIYLSDARRVAPEKLKTVIRHPIKNGRI